MSIHRFKLALAGALAAAMLTGTATGLGGLGRLVAYFGSGADPADALTQIPPADGDGVDWLPDIPQPARALEPATRVAVTDGYLRAWDDITAGAAGDSPYLTGPAGRGAGSDPTGMAARHPRHVVQLEFYSADGQILMLTDTATVVRAVPGDAHRLLVASSVEEYRAIMLLEDGNWRVRSLTRLAGGDPEVRLLADPRPDRQLALAGGALALAVLTFVPGRLRRPFSRERN